MTIVRRAFLSLGFVLLGMSMADAASPRVVVEKTWTDGQQICFLIKFVDVPKNSQYRATIILTGGGGAIDRRSISGANNSIHKICIPIPGSMPGPGTLVTANVYGSNPDDPEPRPAPNPTAPASERKDWERDLKKWKKQTVINGTEVSGINKKAPKIPPGTVEH